MAGQKRSREGTQSLRRAIRLLTDVARADGRSLRLTDLVARSGLDSSTAHRMLACLVSEGLLERSDDRRYRLGRSTLELGLAAERLHYEHLLSRPVLMQLANAFGDTVFLSVHSSAETVCLDRVSGADGGTLLRTDVGTRRPLGIGAGGMAILAAMSAADAERLLRENAPAYRSFDRDALRIVRRRLAAARCQGFALADSYFTPGILGLGVTVPSSRTTPAFAVSVVGRARHVATRREAIAAQLRTAAADVARLIDSRTAV